jgi:hypothetical protein
MLNIKTKIIIIVGIIIITIAASSINSIVSFVQDASAFSLQGIFNKLFGGLFQKSASKQHTQQNANTSVAAPSPPELSSSTIPTACHVVGGGLPDPRCTPGAVNPSVTQDNIRNTICVPGYTKTVRPPVSYTTPLKIRLMESYGFTDSRSNYELDHLIPLEIGGNPYDVRNLWPEPGYGEYNFHIKDRYENYLNNAVCSGSLSLSDAQKDIATNWISNWKNAGQP